MCFEVKEEGKVWKEREKSGEIDKRRNTSDIRQGRKKKETGGIRRRDGGGRCGGSEERREGLHRVISNLLFSLPFLPLSLSLSLP